MLFLCPEVGQKNDVIKESEMVGRYCTYFKSRSNSFVSSAFPIDSPAAPDRLQLFKLQGTTKKDTDVMINVIFMPRGGGEKRKTGSEMKDSRFK